MIPVRLATPRAPFALFILALSPTFAWRAGCAPAPTLEEQIAVALAEFPDLASGHIGFKFIDAETGGVWAARDSARFFTPASNTKLYTTALALVRLGAVYRFRTIVRTSKRISTNDVSVPDLIFVGGGDPNLSGRALPYIEGAVNNDPLTAVGKLADQVRDRGIRQVDGDVIGDDTRYPYDPYPHGWTIDDAIWYYGAPVSALTVNDSSVHVTVRPTEPGNLADIQLQPDFGYFVLLNDVLTEHGNEKRINISRTPGARELVISGHVGRSASAIEEDVAVSDPALFAAESLKFALEQRGITVRGTARAFHLDLENVPDRLNAPRLVNIEQGTELAALDSAPLSQLVQLINKVSQNLHAEMLLREVARATRSVGTLEAGLEERKDFLMSTGLSDTSFTLDDGSGLARQGLTSPDVTVQLLRYMWQRPEREVWLESLAVGGKDGTLKDRFKGIGGAERVRAKTGSLSHVLALSGYLQTRSGRWVIFSMMANAETGHAEDVQHFFDRACGIALQQ